MNVAIAVSLVVATLNLFAGALHLLLARAPGHRRSYTFATIAISAGVYSAINIGYLIDGLPLGAYLTMGRASYFVASVSSLAFFPFAFGKADATLEALTPRVRSIVYGGFALSVIFALTGVHLAHATTKLQIAWGGLHYTYPVTTALGDLYSTVLIGAIAFPASEFVRRARAGEPGARAQLIGFAVYIVAAINEALTASRVYVFPSLMDLGYFAIVMPITIQLGRHFVADATRVSKLSTELEHLVEERTAQRDRAQEALREAERLAALGRLASGVGHEINNPLTYVALGLDVLAPHVEGGSEEARDAFADVRDGVRRIRRVVEGLRTSSSVGSGVESIDPREAVRSALKVSQPSLRHAAQVEVDLGDVPRVMADEAKLVQALVNLLVNAAEAVAESAAAGIIRVSTRPAQQGGVCIEVRDTGAGVDAEQLRRLTEPYFTTRASIGGTGMGLFITNGIVDGMGGRLEFESPPGDGLHVRIVLPSAPPDVAVRVPVTRVAVEPPPGQTKPSAATPIKLLIVDDDSLVARVLARHLRRTCDVTTCNNGQDALNAVSGTSFDVILCDLMMPGMSGMEFASRLDPTLLRRIIFISGGAITEAAEQFLQRQDVRWLPKPVEAAELTSAVAGLAHALREGRSEG